MTEAAARHAAPWPFGTALRPMKYGAILADPPWPFDLYSDETGRAKAPQGQYRLMTAEAIQALPVMDLAAGDCALWLWATWPKLPLALRTMEAWGFRYVTGGAWHKRTRHGRTQIGTGYVMRNACDPFLIGAIGDVPWRPSVRRRTRNLVDAVAREHSRKPDEVYGLLDALLPHAFKAELFARTRWPGWDAWGDEAGKFEARP